MSIEAVIATRDTPMTQCLTSINDNPEITFCKVVVDKGEGQTLIRYRSAKECSADYILLLDDDVVLRPGVVQKYLKKIEEGYDAVCGSTNPAPTGPFGKYVKQYMTNEVTPFYPVGCTLWCPKKFVQVMEEIGVETTNYIAENIIQKQIRNGGYKVVKVHDAVSDHITYVTVLGFFRKRVMYGVAIAELCFIQKQFIKTYLKFFFGIPLSKDRGELVYRFATFMGMTKYLMGYRK